MTTDLPPPKEKKVRKSILQIANEGLTDQVWAIVEARNHKPSIRREVKRLRRLGRISDRGRTVRVGPDPTCVRRDPELGEIELSNGKSAFTICHPTKEIR